MTQPGEEVEILRGPVVIARLVPATDHRSRHLGEDEGLFSVPDDFDGPLPEELHDAFER